MATGGSSQSGQARYDHLKKEFYNRCETILVIKRDPSRSLNPNKVEQYKTELLRDWNAFVGYVLAILDEQNEATKSSVLQSFEQSYKPRLIEALHFIGFHVEIDAETFRAVQNDELTAHNENGGVAEDSADDESSKHSNHTSGDKEMLVVNDFGTNRYVPVPKANRRSNVDFDALYSLDPARIAANRIRLAQTNRVRSPNANARTQNDLVSDFDFYNLCARTFSEIYAGDPLALRPFIHQIVMIQNRCQTDEHENILRDFIMSHVKGIAADLLPAEPESVDEIKRILLSKIKPENAKVVKGRMMALKADRNNLSEFTKKVEQLSDHLKRSLILEKVPLELANEMVIEDTKELCRSNTGSVLVKASLLGNNFKSPREVVANFVIESRKVVEENQILSFRQTNSNSGRGFGNFQRRGNNYGRNFNNYGRNSNSYNHSQNQNQNQNRNFNRGSNQYRGNFRENGSGRGQNHRGRGNYQNNYGNRRQTGNVFYTENENAPPPGAQQVQINQADR